MTPERQKALEAVAEAARAWQQTSMHIEPHSNEECEAYERFEDALRALDALPADPAIAGEVVTLGVIRARLSGQWGATEQPEQEDPRDWTHVCNITFTPPPLPTVPTVDATVLPLTEGGA
jgi:hypothetical protein